MKKDNAAESETLRKINLSAIFIKRPIATTLLALGLAFSGILAYHFLPVSALPKMDFPTISVQANLPGGSPEVMASSVAAPLERQLGRIAGVTELTSSSGIGSTRIVIQFDLSRNIDGAARDVQAAINAARGQLPSDLPNNPSYRKVNPAEAPILILALTSAVFNRGQMYDVASSILSQKLAQVEGVGQVIVGGSSLPAVRVEVNPNALTQYGLGLDDLRQTLVNNNANRPKGNLLIGENSSEISTNDQLFKKEDYLPLIIRYQNAAAVRISDVATVEESVEDLLNAGVADGKPSVVLVLFKQPGSNIIETVDRIKDIIPELELSIPEAIDLTITMDRTTTIRASLEDVEMTLMVAIFLVVTVVYLFLGNFRATIIPSVVVPLSLLGTFGLMYLFDFSLNNLSLMALTIVTGFVVDDAIVVLENISRHRELGKTTLQAAMAGAKEVGFTVLSMSTSLVAVFIPILFMGGIVGRLFREFAITLSIAIFVSLIVSLTVTPMMSAYLLKEDKKKKENKVFIAYEKSLRWTLQHEYLMLLLTFLILIFTLYLYAIVPKGFFPQQDTGRIIAQAQAEQDMSFFSVQQKFDAFVQIIKNDPAVEHVTGFISSNTAGGNAGSLYISLRPLAQRKISADAVIQRLREKLKNNPGLSLYMQASQDLVIGGRTGNAQYQYTLTSETLDELNAVTPLVFYELGKLPGVIDLNSDQRDRGLEIYVKVNRDKASSYGLTTRMIDETLYNAFGQRQVSTLYTAMNQYHVVMEVAPEYWQYPETLNQIYVKSPTQGNIPLSTFAEFIPGATLMAVNHQSQFPSATFSFNLLPGFSLGEVVDTVNNRMNELQLPATVQGAFRGTAAAFQQSLANQPYLS